MAAPSSLTSTRPTPAVRRLIQLIGLAVWTTGVLYWTFDKYMLRHTDIGLSENPLQVWWLRAHAAAATAAVWLFGYMSAIHMQRNWRVGARRNSGALFVATLLLLMLSGYLIYYVEAERSLALLTQLHWVVGLCAPLAFLLHRGMRRRQAAALRPARVEPGAVVPVKLAGLPPPAAAAAATRTAAGLID